MTNRQERPSRRKKVEAEVPSLSAGDLFAHAEPGEPQYADIFDPLFASTPHPELGNLPGESSAVWRPHESWLSPNRLLSLQRILWVGIIGVASIFVYTVFQRTRPAPPAAPSALPPARPAVQQVPVDPAPQKPFVAQEEPPAYDEPEPYVPLPQSLSLQMAERSYFSGDFDSAFATYDRLRRRLPATEQNQAVRDFLLLRMALCNRNSGNMAQADSMFRAVALSRLPILRAIARYHQSMILIDRRQYLEAASRVYQTVALVDLARGDAAWSAAVHRQCQFLVGEALTRNVLALQNTDGNLPDELWMGTAEIDPFVNLDETQLKTLLDTGRKILDQASLTPQIRSVDSQGAAPRWSVTCNGASLEELVARVCSNAGMNVRWLDNGQPTTEGEVGRKRPVYLYLPSATAQQIVAIAAGSAGLLARVDTQNDITILDPSVYSSLAEHKQLLTEESISLWQQFVAGDEDGERVANAHFALALLHTANERLDEAIAEYKLVANRFIRHALAPYALLHAGRLKTRLRDYVGAHDDLKQLIELYPDVKFSDQACLELADATMKAKRYEEAAGLYRRVFNRGLSRESQIKSSLGTGRCFYEMQDPESAAYWLNRYVAMARDQNRPEFHSACLLLGKTYLSLNNPSAAQGALALALRGELSREEHVETVSTLVRAYIQQELYADAFNVLEGTQAWQLSQQETIELLLLRAQILRSIGLTDRAMALLAEQSPFLPSPELKGAMALELAACHAADGDLTQARQTLSAAFAAVEPGDLAQRIGAELAELCLQEDQPEQAVSVCSQLLQYGTGKQRERLLRLQAGAYRRQGQYGRAVTTLLSRPTEGAASTMMAPAGTSGALRQQ
jgi:tetratricopeptide (TPR) repeat protein